MSRNSVTLQDFVAFCEAQPELRFWQALAVWMSKDETERQPYILLSNLPPYLVHSNADLRDTFGREGK